MPDLSSQCFAVEVFGAQRAIHVSGDLRDIGEPNADRE